MVMVVKRFETYVSLGNLGLFLLFLKEVAFSLRKLGPFPRENSLFHKELDSSFRNFFYS
jgi:hypothetical protein